MLKLARRAKGHFMTLIEIRVHLIRCKPGHISLIRCHSHYLLSADLAVKIPFSTRSRNRSFFFFFGRLNRSFPSSNCSTSTNATRDSRYSVNANLNLNQFRQAMLDGV